MARPSSSTRSTEPSMAAWMSHATLCSERHLLGVEQPALGRRELGRRGELGGGHLLELALVEPHLAGGTASTGPRRVGDAARADAARARIAARASTCPGAAPIPVVTAASAGRASPVPGSGGADTGGAGSAGVAPSDSPRVAVMVTPSPASRSSTIATRWPGSTCRSEQPPLAPSRARAAPPAVELPGRDDVDLGATDGHLPRGADRVPAQGVVVAREQLGARERVVDPVAVPAGDRGARVADLQLGALPRRS